MLKAVKTDEYDLPDLIKNPPNGPIKMLITPELAEQMLEYNTKNRALSKGTINKYARQMSSGAWHDATADAIVFSTEGRITNGQHRLQAVVVSRVPLTSWVHFGDPDRNFAIYDSGKIRTGGDIFKINEVPNSNTAAAITRFIYVYEHGSLSGRAGTATGLDNQEQLYQFYLQCGADLIQESVHVAQTFGKQRMPSPAMAGGAHFVCARRNRQQADEFFHKLATGLGFTSARDPARRLREHLIRTELNRLAYVGDIIHTWNQMRSRKNVGQWYSTKGGRFPRAI